MAKNVKITDKKTKNWILIEQNLKEVQKGNAKVFVGILEEDFDKPHGDEGKVTLGEVAVFNEFGTSKAPARSFIRAPFEAKQRYEKLVKSALKRVFDGTYSVNSALNVIGSSIAKSFIKWINDGTDMAPNTEATIDRKLSDKPLIDHGDLRDHITYKINK